jgi:hypothetical protein
MDFTSRQNNVANGFLSSWIQKLNPNASSEKWSFDENCKLFALFRAKKNRWKQISLNLTSRTDNAAKNQLFALIRKGLRKACRSIGLLNNTATINMIKPKILLNFFESTFITQSTLSTDSTQSIVISELIEFYALRYKGHSEYSRDVVSQLIDNLIKQK